MPRQKRVKTDYPGVYYIQGKGARGKERIFYISYRRDGELIEEKAGWKYRDDMTPARASGMRARRIDRQELSNQERREQKARAKMAELGKWTISRLWDAYCAERTENKTLKSDRYRFNKFLQKPFGDKAPADIIKDDVVDMRDEMMKTYSPQSVKHTMALLLRIANYGHEEDLCPGLSFVVEKPTVDNIKTEYLTGPQLRRLVQAIEADEHPCVPKMMLMVLYSGMRRGELFKLCWRDIDFENNHLYIRQPKGGKAQWIPLSKQARGVLKSLPQGPPEAYVFPGKDGAERQQIYPVTRRILEAAGIPKGFRPMHGLRHHYATALASSGKVSQHTLQRMLTHKDPRMTARYAHHLDKTLKAAATVAGGLVSKAIKVKKR